MHQLPQLEETAREELVVVLGFIFKYLNKKNTVLMIQWKYNHKFNIIMKHYFFILWCILFLEYFRWMQENHNANKTRQNSISGVTEWVNSTIATSTRGVRPTVLQAHPQLLVVFLLHVIDDVALVLEGVCLLDAGHEVSLHHRAGRAVEQVTIWKILIQAPSFLFLCADTLHLPIKNFWH